MAAYKLRKWLAQKYVRYGLLSIASPIFTVVGVMIFQSINNQAFWKSVAENPHDDANTHAIVFLTVADFIIQLYAAAIASFFGLLLAVLSLKNQRKILGFGLLATIFNGVPVILFLVLFGRIWLTGGV